MPKLLWVSAYSLHDPSSGAAIDCRTMLEQLALRGVAVTALCSFFFDRPWGAGVFPNLDEMMNSEQAVFEFDDGGVRYNYMKCASRSERDHTSHEQRRFFGRFIHLLKTFTPDVLMGYGGDCLSKAVRAEARLHRIPVVFCLCNEKFQGWTFADCDCVICPSRALAQLYRDKAQVLVQPVGIFVRKEHFVAEERTPDYVTLINPQPAKGLSIFVRLALAARKELPEVRFLVVQSRGDFRRLLGGLHPPDGTQATLDETLFPNVHVGEPTRNMKAVYARTKVLLVPSLCFEAWGRVATEAVLNGIPVLASASGGLPEAVGKGGLTLPVPPACLKDHKRIPTEEEIQPWLDGLKRLLNEDWTEHCARAAGEFDLEAATDRVMRVLEPLWSRPAGMDPMYLRRGCVR